MRIIKLTLALSLLFCLSCKTAKNTTSGKKGKAGIACADIGIKGPHFDWIIEKDSALKGYTERPLPAAYKVYSIDSEQLHSFLAFATAHPEDTTLQISIPLPEPIGCRIFDLPTTKARPGSNNELIMAMWGKDNETKQNSIKINFDGKKLFANIAWDAKAYVILPLQFDDKIYYITYLKTDVPQRPAVKQSASPKIYRQTFDR